MTPELLVLAIAAGFVFGLALPTLFCKVTEELIPREYIDVLNAAAGAVVPLLALPLGACWFLALVADDLLHGRSPEPTLARAVTYATFVFAVTFGDLLWQRLRGQGTTTMSARVADIDRQVHESEARLQKMSEADDRARLRALDARMGHER